MVDFDKIDQQIASFMDRWGTVCLRYSLAIIFLWFGILKPLGLSPAEPLVRLTAGWMPLLHADAGLALIGWWEVVIGLTFLTRRTVRIAIALLAVQMIGTFLPLVILPHLTFESVPFVPTLEGQYIVKNLLIISAALVVGGTVRKIPESTTASVEPS